MGPEEGPAPPPPAPAPVSPPAPPPPTSPKNARAGPGTIGTSQSSSAKTLHRVCIECKRNVKSTLNHCKTIINYQYHYCINIYMTHLQKNDHSTGFN